MSLPTSQQFEFSSPAAGPDLDALAVNPPPEETRAALPSKTQILTQKQLSDRHEERHTFDWPVAR